MEETEIACLSRANYMRVKERVFKKYLNKATNFLKGIE
jgi:hypothetical protein